MGSILHVLNGDSTLHSFNETGLEGDVIVWREVLSEGPLLPDITSAEFWETRATWIKQTFKEQPEQYRRKVVSELEKLNELYREINLWFEFDLHCQVNLLGCLNLLERRADLSPPAVFLICPNAFPGVDDFRGIGQLNGRQLESLFDTRVQLANYDFRLAEQAWNAYVSSDVDELQQFIDTVDFWGALPLLKPALAAHIKRLITDNQGLNYIEQELLNIYQSGIKKRAEIYQGFWRDNKIYGMGDAQLDIYLNQLEKKHLLYLDE